LSIAGYEASAEVKPFTSKFDAVLAGKAQFTPQEQAGYALFRGKAQCNNCHRDGGPGEDLTGNTTALACAVRACGVGGLVHHSVVIAAAAAWQIAIVVVVPDIMRPRPPHWRRSSRRVYRAGRERLGPGLGGIRADSSERENHESRRKASTCRNPLTDRIIAALEQGVRPWHEPWAVSHAVVRCDAFQPFVDHHTRARHALHYGATPSLCRRPVPDLSQTARIVVQPVGQARRAPHCRNRASFRASSRNSARATASKAPPVPAGCKSPPRPRVTIRCGMNSLMTTCFRRCSSLSFCLRHWMR
jgi:hypothetical protein